MSQLRLAVLMLAAGDGRRLGSHPKALLKKDGETLFERCLEAVRPFAPVEFILLTGFHAELIESKLEKYTKTLPCPITIVRNKNPGRGQASSVRLGLESLKTNFDLLLIALSDQVHITHKEISQLLHAFDRRKGCEQIVLPVFKGRRGNPVIFSRQAILSILAQPDLACRPYMDSHPEQVHSMNTLNEAFVLDVDTPEDMQAFGLTT